MRSKTNKTKTKTNKSKNNSRNKSIKYIKIKKKL